MQESIKQRTNFEVGEKASITKKVSEEDVIQFAKVTLDANPILLDASFAQKSRFKNKIAHGMLSAGLISAVLGTKLPGVGTIYLHQSLSFVAPVYFGDEITAEATITSWNPEKRIAKLLTRCFNQDNKDVLTGEAVIYHELIDL
jgi:3-hydroxybutyryl-CoA dehydratase